VPTGETISLEQIAEHGQSAGTAAPVRSTASAASGGSDPFAEMVAQTYAAIGAGELAGAIALIMSLDRTAETADQHAQVQSLLARTGAEAGAAVDVTESVRPLVDLVLELRAQARTEKRWAESDTIRDGLAAAGIEVRDTPDGVEWEVRR
jgi:cysteinyl-tRNA synthetase